MDLTLAEDGAERHPGAAEPALGELRDLASEPGSERAGRRLFGLAALRPLLAADGIIGALPASLDPDYRPVRALLFDKNAEANWSVGWHQDRTIAVAERQEVAGFGPWTVKGAVHHVAPPFDVLADMVTLRVHLDDVDQDNAPLMIARGSHRFGRVPENRIGAVVEGCSVHQCLADAGDIWIYATPILHASRPAARPGRRRVLQVDYSAAKLPDGLEWLGI